MNLDAPNTEFSYMYRDASNYKQHASVVFAGRPTAEELAAIKGSLDDGEFFIPSQVGLEDLQERWGRLYEDDHVWHEVDVEQDFQPTFRAPDMDVDIHAFAEAMAAAEWDVLAAMREHGLETT